MEQLRRKLEEFMKGRNGPDELGRDIGIVSLVIYFISVLGKNLEFYILSSVRKEDHPAHIARPVCKKLQRQ